MAAFVNKILLPLPGDRVGDYGPIVQQAVLLCLVCFEIQQRKDFFARGWR